MRNPMDHTPRRPLFAMAAAYLLLVIAALGTGSLWPVYISQLGGGPSASGVFNAVGNLSGVAGILLSGWLADRIKSRKRFFYAGCILFASTWWLMTRATTWQQLTWINVAGGFTFCIALNMIMVLTGLLAGEKERGRSFGLLSLTMGIGQLVGGLVCGPIADRFGFPALFMVNTLLCLGCMLPGLFFREPAPAAATALAADGGPVQKESGRAGLGRSFYPLVAVSLLIGLATFGASLGRSIVMDQLRFSATDISLAAAIGGAVSLPTPLIIGWLSDRIGRKRLLLGCLAAGLVALLAFARAGTPLSFWVASAVGALAGSASPLLQALATDRLPAGSVGAGLSLLSSASSAGLFVSSLGVGAAVQELGGRPAFLLTALAPLIAIALLLPIREKTARPAPQPTAS